MVLKKLALLEMILKKLTILEMILKKLTLLEMTLKTLTLLKYTDYLSYTSLTAETVAFLKRKRWGVSTGST